MTIDAQMIAQRVQNLNSEQSAEMGRLIKSGCDMTIALTLVEKMRQ